MFGIVTKLLKFISLFLKVVCFVIIEHFSEMLNEHTDIYLNKMKNVYI